MSERCGEKGEVLLAVTGTVNRTANWVTAYILVASIGLTMVGLVMLFSAGAVRGAQDAIEAGRLGSHLLARRFVCVDG